MNPIDIDELIRILPTLIRENDTVKGAIITALSGVVATKEDIKELILQMDKRFEAVDKRFEAVDKRFEAVQQQMDKRFDAMQQQMDKRFTKVETILNEIRQTIGRPFEQFGRNIVTRILNAEGFKNITITPIKLPDLKHAMGPGSTEVEIDGLNQNPPVIVEITSILREHSEIDWFIKKKQFIESHYNRKFRGFFIAASTECSSDQIVNIAVLLRENNSELINL
jgi:hypothetical protein